MAEMPILRQKAETAPNQKIKQIKIPARTQQETTTLRTYLLCSLTSTYIRAYKLKRVTFDKITGDVDRFWSECLFCLYLYTIAAAMFLKEHNTRLEDFVCNKDREKVEEEGEGERGV